MSPLTHIGAVTLLERYQELIQRAAALLAEGIRGEWTIAVDIVKADQWLKDAGVKK